MRFADFCCAFSLCEASSLRSIMLSPPGDLKLLALTKMLNSDSNVQECDATADAISTIARAKNKFASHRFVLLLPGNLMIR